MRRAVTPDQSPQSRHRIRRGVGVTVLFAVVAVSFATTVAPKELRAQAARGDMFTGRYVLDTARSDRIEQRVEATVRGMNFIKRPIARKRLLRVNQPAPMFELRFHADTGRLVVPSESPIPLAFAREDLPWTNADGERFAVSTYVTSGVTRLLLIKFEAEDGERTNMYRLDDDGRGLSLTVTVESPQLDTPLRYTLRYRRD
jgi:hypothetical protein